MYIFVANDNTAAVEHKVTSVLAVIVCVATLKQALVIMQ